MRWTEHKLTTYSVFKNFYTQCTYTVKLIVKTVRKGRANFCYKGGVFYPVCRKCQKYCTCIVQNSEFVVVFEYRLIFVI